MLNNLHEFGTDSFVRSLVAPQVNPSAVNLASMSLVCNQYLNFWEFADRLNILFGKIVEVSDAKNTKDLAQLVAGSFKGALDFERVRLWYLDNVGLSKTSVNRRDEDL